MKFYVFYCYLIKRDFKIHWNFFQSTSDPEMIKDSRCNKKYFHNIELIFNLTAKMFSTWNLPWCCRTFWKHERHWMSCTTLSKCCHKKPQTCFEASERHKKWFTKVSDDQTNKSKLFAQPFDTWKSFYGFSFTIYFVHDFNKNKSCSILSPSPWNHHQVYDSN